MKEGARLLCDCILLLLATGLLAGPALAQANGPPPYGQEAAAGIQTLQSWYTQSTGLYRTTGWWNSANAITVLANYSRSHPDQSYRLVFANTFRRAQKHSKKFINHYYDDEGWWALAWIDVYDLTKKPEYLSMAQAIFTDMAKGWDATCGGGVWWSKDKAYKNAIANELFLSVAANLAIRSAKATERAQYLDWAHREWRWFAASGLMNEQHLINDGLDSKTCKNNQANVWSYNQGAILGGLIALNNAAPDPILPSMAQAIASAALARLTDANGILHESCEPNCGVDCVQFKGIFVRNLRALNETFPDPRYVTFFNTNAQSIWNTSRSPKNKFGEVWSGPFDAGNAAIQSSALDVFVAAEACARH
ncbi:MAG: glycoside hydrolase family 76 protein [Candidatus Acidiferrales bacterium]